MSGSSDDSTDNVSLLIKLFSGLFKLLSGISKVTIHHLDFAIQELKLGIFLLDYLLLNLDNLTHEFPVHIFTSVSLLFHILNEGFIFPLSYLMFPELLEGFRELRVKGSFSIIIISAVVSSE